MICLVRSDLVMTYASPSCTRLLGWEPAEMEGNGPDMLVHPEDLPIVGAARKELAKHGEDKTPTVVRIKRKSGGYAWMEINARVVPESVGADYRIVLTKPPKTAHKKASFLGWLIYN